MRHLLLLTCLLAASTQAYSQVFDESFEHWPVDLRINGKVILAGRLEDPAVLADVVKTIRGQDTLFLFDEGTPAAVISQFQSLIASDPQSPDEQEKSDSETPEAGSPITETRSVDVIHRIPKLLSECKIFFWHASVPLSNAEVAALVEERAALRSYIASGGTLIAIGESAECCAQLFTRDDSANPAELVGLNLLPDCVLETGYHDNDQSRLLSILAAHPRLVGIGLPDNMVLTLSGRKITVAGSGSATILLMANDRQPIRTQAITSARSRDAFGPREAVDLTEWRRDAIDRTLPVFPPVSPGVPLVENGTLVIVGGGGMPNGLMARIVELAGGPEAARMVYVPCAEEDEVSARQGTVESWKRMGVKHATFIHTKDRLKANSDEAFLAPLRDATGLWFGGGRQWNFADSYYGTKAHELMKDVLRRGGVIGGSSAGASIQARYLARATPIGNFDIMAPGYERGGLGFIDGVAIDQHFTQRGRQKDMTQLVNRYPQLLGIGIDEATAIVVQKSVAEVVGKGRVHFYDRKLPVYPDRPDFIALPAGSAYDLAERKVLTEGTPPPQDPPQTSSPGTNP